MKRKFLSMTGVAVAAAAVLLLTLGGAGRTPNVSADNYDYEWDVVICDDQAAPDCAGSHGQDNAGTPGVIEVGDNPEMQSHLAIDPEPYTYDVAFFGLATTTWKGIAPAPEGAITHGDQVGHNWFAIDTSSTISTQGTSGVDGTTGQPLVCGAAGTITLSETFPTYASDVDIGDGIDNDGDTSTDEEILNTLDDDGDQHEDGTRGNPGDDECTDGIDNDGVEGTDGDDPNCSGSAELGIDEDNRSVSSADEDDDGTQEEFEDNVLADCLTLGANGLYDGIDCLPEPIVDYYIPMMHDQGYGDPVGRAFGMAPILGGIVKVPVNFVLYEYDTDGDTVDDGYLSFTLVLYPGATASEQVGPENVTSQTTLTCTPFASNTVQYGITQGNPDYDADGDTTAEGIPGGVVNRTVVADGTFDYLIALSLADNYDSDDAAEQWESCPQYESTDTDLAGPPDPISGLPIHVDPDFDRWDSGPAAGPMTCGDGGDEPCCDPYPGSPDNDNDGNLLNYNLPPPGTWPMDPDNCNTAYTPPLLGGWDCDQDVDGDGYLNTVDNCPFTPDADVDGDMEVDWQKDSDSDTVGDVCDPSPDQYGTKGDGDGYKEDVHPHGSPDYPDSLGYYHDHDDACNDEFTIPGTEPSGGGVCPAQDEGVGYVDSSNEGDPDWYDQDGSGTYTLGEPIDTSADSDADGYTDACEAVVGYTSGAPGSDPLDADSTPAYGGASPGLDCDGDTTPDEQEEADGTNPFPIPLADIAVESFTAVEPPAAYPDPELDEIHYVFAVSSEMIVTLEEIKHNYGPDPTVADVTWEAIGFNQPEVNVRWTPELDDECTFDGAPVDCVTGGPGGDINDLHFEVPLPVSEDILITRDITFHCKVPGTFTGQLINREVPAAGQPEDPDMTNNSVTIDVIIDCVAPATPMEKVIVSIYTEAQGDAVVSGDGVWTKVADDGHVGDLPPGVPPLPHADPPRDPIQVKVSENFTLITNDLDWSQFDVWIDKTATLAVTAGNCEVNGGPSDTQVINEFEPEGYSVQPAPLLWDVHLVVAPACTLTYTLAKEPKLVSPLVFPPQVSALDIEIEESACEPPLVDLGLPDPDSDCDGAPDADELGPVPASCGTRDPNDPWDFYNVPVPTLGRGGDMYDRDSAVTILSDVLGVLEYSGTSLNGPPNGVPRDYDDDNDTDGNPDGMAYDRSVGVPWSAGPDDSITILTDVLLVLAQSGHGC